MRIVYMLLQKGLFLMSQLSDAVAAQTAATARLEAASAQATQAAQQTTQALSQAQALVERLTADAATPDDLAAIEANSAKIGQIADSLAAPAQTPPAQ